MHLDRAESALCWTVTDSMLKLEKQLYSNTVASRRYGDKFSEMPIRKEAALPVSAADTTVVYPAFSFNTIITIWGYDNVPKINWVNCNQSLIFTITGCLPTV